MKGSAYIALSISLTIAAASRELRNGVGWIVTSARWYPSRGWRVPPPGRPLATLITSHRALSRLASRPDGEPIRAEYSLAQPLRSRAGRTVLLRVARPRRGSVPNGLAGPGDTSTGWVVRPVMEERVVVFTTTSAMTTEAFLTPVVNKLAELDLMSSWSPGTGGPSSVTGVARTWFPWLAE